MFPEPVPKTSNPQALTSIVMRSLERIVLDQVLWEVRNKLDPLQFACTNGRSTEDALFYVSPRIYCHLGQPKQYARAMIIEFSSAFNAVKPPILMERLLQLEVNSRLIRWVLFDRWITRCPIECCSVLPFHHHLSLQSNLYTTECGANSSNVLNVKFDEICWYRDCWF